MPFDLKALDPFLPVDGRDRAYRQRSTSYNHSKTLSKISWSSAVDNSVHDVDI